MSARDKGLTTRQIAAEVGASHTTVQNDLAIKLPKNGNKVASSTRALLSQSDQTDWRAPRKLIQRWPARAELFARKKDDGVAEAALIAVAGLMRKGGAP